MSKREAKKKLFASFVSGINNVPLSLPSVYTPLGLPHYILILLTDMNPHYYLLTLLSIILSFFIIFVVQKMNAILIM